MVGIYIHWPFCKSKCPYCDFNSYVVRTIDQKLWLDHYMQDLDNYHDEYKGKTIETVFFGGGTPSLMSPKIVEAIIDRLKPLSDAEITLEVNPSSAEMQSLQDFKLAGINRLSIGVQSFRDENLKFLGRLHNAREAISIIELVSTMFDNFSFDLIYGLYDDTLEKWKEDLNFAMSFNPNHISLYQLMIEEKTKFHKLYSQNKLKVLDDDTAIELYHYTNEYLSERGIHQYEISNYAKKGFEGRHNLKYWHYQEYLGYGPGAHSRIHTNQGIFSREMENVPLKWLRNRGEKKELLPSNEVLKEVLMMGLRLKSGVQKSTIQSLNYDWNVITNMLSDIDGIIINNNSIYVNKFDLFNCILVKILLTKFDN